jgi:hypothetical protein
MQRLGVAVVPQRGITMARHIEMAQDAERQGYESLWLGESNGFEAFTFLSAILSHTERISVAPGIASIFTRTPACQDHVRRFVAAGVTLPIIMPFAPDASQASYLRTIAAFQTKRT